MNTFYRALILSLFPLITYGQGAVVYDPAQYGNMLKQLLESSKQTAQQEAIYVEAAKQTVQTKQLSQDIGEILTIQEKVVNAMNKYSEIIPVNPSDFMCLLQKMGEMFKNNLPKVYFNTAFSLLKFNCNESATKLYNVINPYNLYAKSSSAKQGSIYGNYSSQEKYYNSLKESHSLNLGLAEMSQKNKVEMASLYEKMGEDKINQAKRLLTQVNLVEAPEMKIKLREDLDKFTREGMEYKQKSIDLLVEVGNTKTRYQEMESEKEKSKRIRHEVSKITPLRYGNF